MVVGDDDYENDNCSDLAKRSYGEAAPVQNHSKASQHLRCHVAGGLPWNWMLHFFAIEACSTATICPFI